jgi:hypothetical protein
MSLKAKSGLTATRQFPEKILEPPNTFTGGATSFTSGIRDGKGHSSLHVAAANATPFTLKILHSWRTTGPFTLHKGVLSTLDVETFLFVAEVLLPVAKRYVKIVVDAPGPGLDTNTFEIGAYFLPRTPLSSIISSNTGSGSTTSVKGVPGLNIGPTPADIAVGVGATVALPAAPAGTRRRTVQVTGGSNLTRIRVREVGAGAGRGKILTLLGSTIYGGADGAIASLEVQNVAGPAASVMVQDERD